MAKKPTIEHVDASIARWKTRLRRAMTALDKLEKQKKRLVKAAVQPRVITDMREITKAPTRPEPLAVTILREMAAPPKPYGEVLDQMDHQAKYQPAVEDEIPAFLRRQSSPSPEAEQIKAEQAETKKKKAAGRIAKMKAKKSGETRKMPLTGKAALAAIRNG